MPAAETQRSALYEPLTVEQFEQLLQEQYREFRTRAPSNMLALHFSDLNYSVRIRAVVMVTRDRGYSLPLDHFNNVVVGRLKFVDVPTYINQCVQTLIEQKQEETPPCQTSNRLLTHPTPTS